MMKYVLVKMFWIRQENDEIARLKENEEVFLTQKQWLARYQEFGGSAQINDIAEGVGGIGVDYFLFVRNPLYYGRRAAG